MERNFGLDLIRSFSLWLVLLQHAGINIPGLQPLKIGGIGVEIFFVLSGFLIGGILLKEIDKGKSVITTLKTFWIRRWFRILPLYYAILIFKFCVLDSSVGWNILYYFAFLQNNFYGINFFGVSWTLVIEEWFYIFVPLFLILCYRVLKTNKKVIIAILAFIVVVNIARFLYVFLFNIPYNGVNGNFPFRFDSLFLGVLLAFLKHNDFNIFKKLESKYVFFLGLFLLCVYIFYYWNLAYPEKLIDQTLFPKTLGFFILPLCISLTIPFVATFRAFECNNMIKKGCFNFVTWTSILTYAIYLVHSFIYSVTFSETFYVESYIGQLSIGIVLTYLISFIVYFAFEKPILTYRNRKYPARQAQI